MDDIRQLEHLIQQEVNEYRQGQGGDILGYSTAVADTARLNSKRMWREDFFSHTDRFGHGVQDRFENTRFSCGENILFIPRNTSTLEWGLITVARGNDLHRITIATLAIVIAQDWINSRSHEANIRREQYQIGGVGVYYAIEDEELYVTHNMCFEK